MTYKVRQIKFIKSEVFKTNSTITLFDEEVALELVPTIFFLVGNNGSGKTSIMNYLFHGLGEGKQGVYGNSTLCSGTKFETSGIGINPDIVSTVNNTGIINNHYPENLRIILDEVNTSFQVEKITAITALTADEDENPREKAKDLGKLIPQLLANIKAEDDAYIADFIRENEHIPNYTRKLDRFTGAFNNMYGGAKVFSRIINQDGEKKIIFKDNEGADVDMKSFSTGEKQIIFRVGNLLKNLSNLDNAIILIDEPETSLHPKWQQRYVKFLLDTFDGLDIQFIIATHSPYILQAINHGQSVAIKVDRNRKDINGDDILEIGETIGYYPNSLRNPSINLINYIAYGILDEMLHIELLTALEVKLGVNYKGLKHYLSQRNIITKSHTASVSYVGVNVGDQITEPLPIYIRNSIHHPNEIARIYSKGELELSIEFLLSEL